MFIFLDGKEVYSDRIEDEKILSVLPHFFPSFSLPPFLLPSFFNDHSSINSVTCLVQLWTGNVGHILSSSSPIDTPPLLFVDQPHFPTIAAWILCDNLGRTQAGVVPKVLAGKPQLVSHSSQSAVIKLFLSPFGLC